MKNPETQQRVLRYLFSKKGQEGFTLVELIVVVVIIGILSSIAIPSFQNASDKAKQKEASVLASAYIKATQAYYAEFGSLPRYAEHLGYYMSITGCAVRDPQICKANPPLNLQTSKVYGWNSPSGLYQVDMSFRTNGPHNQIFFLIDPTGSYTLKGYAVTACFNGYTGATRHVEHTYKGPVKAAFDCY